MIEKVMVSKHPLRRVGECHKEVVAPYTRRVGIRNESGSDLGRLPWVGWRRHCGAVVRTIEGLRQSGHDPERSCRAQKSLCSRKSSRS